MNIEESIEILKNSKNLYLKEKIDSDILEEAIEALLTAYEKEKEKNKELIKQHTIEITDVGGNSIKIDLDGKIHNVYKIEEE